MIASGVIVLDKPSGLSSAQAVDSVKRALGAKRAGHAGTLDPIATGVLPICINEATKIAGFMLAEDKAYEADMVLGVETDTLDRTGNPTATRPVDVTREQIVAALVARTGEYDQVPPMFSAIKRDGVRLYARARAGEHIEIEPRRINIASLELLAHDGPRVRFAVACSKGTYVRSLVADLGNDLGCGAHLAELRRTRCGVFAIGDAVAIDAVAGFDPARLVPLARATNLPSVELAAELLRSVRSGVQLPIGMLRRARGSDWEPKPNDSSLVDEVGALVAVVHVDAGRLVYDRVFAP